MIANNLANIQTTITTAENEHQRTPGSVRLLAVSKKKPVELILQAITAGQRSFGENYADEGVSKIQQLTKHKLEWHYIGHIQSNKTRLISSHYDWVQSVERLKIAERLAQHRPPELGPLNICLQVNVDGEQTKSGCTPEELPALADFVASQQMLHLRGIMAIPAPQQDELTQRAVFAKINALYKSLQQHETIDTLSMGMTADLSAAIAEGSTMVRIGTAIFGKRE